MAHPKAKGDRSTLAIMLALVETGYSVYEPFGENTRTDLIIERDGVLARVQCKTGRLRHGAVRFNTCSYYAHHPNPTITTRDYLGDVDYFAVYCRENGGAYLVPIEDIPLRRLAALRVDPPLNKQQKRIRFAADYEIGQIAIGDASSEPGVSAGAPGSSA